MRKIDEIKKKGFNYLKYLILYGYPGKILGALIALIVIMPIPFDVYLLARWGFSPEGFWQNIVLFAIWAIILGWLQIIFVVSCLAFAIGILTDSLY